MPQSETFSPNPVSHSDTMLTPQALVNRRGEVDFRHELLTHVLDETQSEGLLLTLPENVAWLTSGGHLPHSAVRSESVAAFIMTQGRWILCNSSQTQRLFDEELDRLGFQVKEWAWYHDAEALLADLVTGRKMVADQPFRDLRVVDDRIAAVRTKLSIRDLMEYRLLGTRLAHALEATARNFARGETEIEIAAQLSHRLQRHEIEPIRLEVCGDERALRYPEGPPTGQTVNRFATVKATGRFRGLHATASRMVCFGPPDDAIKAEVDWATRLSAVWLAAGKVDEAIGDVIHLGKRLLKPSPYEHDWRRGPGGFLTGYRPVEAVFRPSSPAKLEAGSAIVWSARVGRVDLCDTFILTGSGWEFLTPVGEWPIRRVTLSGLKLDRPDILVRAIEEVNV